MTYVVSGSQFHREVAQIEFEKVVSSARRAGIELPEMGRKVSLGSKSDPLLWQDIQEMREVSAATRSIQIALSGKKDHISAPGDPYAAMIPTGQLIGARDSLLAVAKAVRELLGSPSPQSRGEIIAEDLSTLESAFKRLHKDPKTKSVASKLASRLHAAQKSFQLVQRRIQGENIAWPDQQTKDLAQQVREAHAELLRALEEFRNVHAPTRGASEPVDEKLLSLGGIRIALPGVAKDFRKAVFSMIDTYIPTGNVTCH